MTALLHYIYDPLCGWCYGAAPLIAAARDVLPMRAHGGGMMTGARRQPVTPQLRAYVNPHDARIAALSGQHFGAGYRDGLLHDTGAVYDSEPPTIAILAADALAGRGLDMLAALHVAHYVDGRRIAERDVLIAIAQSLGFDADVFADAYDAHAGAVVQDHMQRTRALMARVQAPGYPTLLLETAEGWQRIELPPFYGDPQGFRHWLQARVATTAATQDDARDEPVCSIDGCAPQAARHDVSAT